MDTNQSGSVLEVKGEKTVPNKAERLAKEDVMLLNLYYCHSLLIVAHIQTQQWLHHSSNPHQQIMGLFILFLFHCPTANTRYFCSSSWPPRKDSHNTRS